MAQHAAAWPPGASRRARRGWPLEAGRAPPCGEGSARALATSLQGLSGIKGMGDRKGGGRDGSTSTSVRAIARIAPPPPAAPLHFRLPQYETRALANTPHRHSRAAGWALTSVCASLQTP